MCRDAPSLLHTHVALGRGFYKCTRLHGKHLCVPLALLVQVGSSRFVLLLLWMSKTGLGWVQGRDIVGAARRMRVT